MSSSAASASLALSLIAGLALVACMRPSTTHVAGAASASDYTGAIKKGAGIACSYLGSFGPPSYPVRDIGKHGVPAVNSGDMRTLRLMMRYVHPSTLRFAYLDGGFAVFDATGGPCSATPYAILNAPGCNAIYVPFDGTDKTGAATGCNMRPRPWIPHDIGNPRGFSWADYPNSH